MRNNYPLEWKGIMSTSQTHAKLALETIKQLPKKVAEFTGTIDEQYKNEVFMGAVGPDLVYCEGTWRLCELTHWMLGHPFDPSPENILRLQPFIIEMFRYAQTLGDPSLAALAFGYTSHVIVDQFTHYYLSDGELGYADTLALQTELSTPDEIWEFCDKMTIRPSYVSFLCHAYLVDAPSEYLQIPSEEMAKIEQVKNNLKISKEILLKDFFPCFESWLKKDREKIRQLASKALAGKGWNRKKGLDYIKRPEIQNLENMVVKTTISTLERLGSTLSCSYPCPGFHT